ncbi:MAG: hypothetical protein M1814_002369 [Vezdaea aestivalis]|nr:MAG: hypothetical protein M1814_002369 [Vezdaea aestivalis]
MAIHSFLPSVNSMFVRFVTLLAASFVLQVSSGLFPGVSPYGVHGRIVGEQGRAIGLRRRLLDVRAGDETDVCVRWSHQTAIVNGTMFIYGGQAKASSSQNSDTWNDNLLSLSLSSSFQISSPTLKQLPQPSGPPAVANGYLWNSFTSLYLYGGLFSDKPVTSPVPYSTWEYKIASSSWTEHASPKTSAGNFSEPDGVAIQRSAEGAGLSVPQLGKGWYFGGHLDGYTTVGWSQSIARIYLKSFVEYTFPGYTNNGVKSLGGGKKAPDEGVWRNITGGGLQDKGGFTERADGVLVYIPGWGDEGIIVGLAGGTNETFSQMNVVDIYDIGTSTWYKQATSGTTPAIRVNPCAIAVAAPDGSSIQIHLYGGQNLIPYGDQHQYDDMWILTVPSFTWIKVDTSKQSIPPARAGHSCNVWNAQMIVVGGYVGKDLSCDSPGVYIFNTSSLQWQNSYVALKGPGSDDPLNQQPAFQDASKKKGYPGLIGSYGYTVPQAVIDVVGGNPSGAATLTKPALAPTGGPVASGVLPTFTVTGVGPTTTAIVPGSGAPTGASRAVIIAISVVAACLAVLAAYLGFCLWLYRKQLALYKRHVALVQRSNHNSFENDSGPEKLLTLPPGSSSEPGSSHGSSRRGTEGHSYGPVRLDGEDDADLMRGHEPTFVGVLLSPRRSLRVVNRD